MTLSVKRGEGVRYTVVFKNTGSLKLNFVVSSTLRNRATGYEMPQPYKLIREVYPGESRMVVKPYFFDTTTWDGREWEWIVHINKNFQGGIPVDGYPPDWYRGGTLIGELDENLGFDRNIRII